jgi:hypothetical protein
MVIRSLIRFAANLLVIYGNVSISHKGNGARSTSFLPPESSGSTTFGFPDQSDGDNNKHECQHKRRLNNVTAPGYDSLILEFSASSVGKVE